MKLITVQKSIINTFLTLTFILGLPLVTLLIVPFLIWREIIKQLSKLLCKNNGKMLHSFANLFAIEYPKMFQKKSIGTLYVTVFLKGHVTLPQVMEQGFQLIDAKSPDNPNQLRNPELRQTIVKWLGYYFWRWDSNFKLENHVRLYDGPGKIEIESEQDLSPIYKHLTSKSFTPERSPWECLVWENARLKQNGEISSILFFRCHHALCDGFGFMKGILGDLQVEKIKEKLVRPQTKKSSAKILIQNLSLIWRIPRDLARFRGNYNDVHPWNLSHGKLTGNLNTAKTGPIEIKLIKEIKKLHGTSFHAIIQAAMTGGLRNFMTERDIQIPPKFSCFIALPMKGHPSKMRNYSTAVFTHLPIGLSDPRDRVRAIEKNVLNLRHSTVPVTNFLVSRVWSCLPPWLMQTLDVANGPTCVLSNFPGPINQIEACQRPIEFLHFGAGIMRRIGISMNCLSYDGHVRFGLAVDDAISPHQEFVDDLAQKIMAELQVLKSIEIV